MAHIATTLRNRQVFGGGFATLSVEPVEGTIVVDENCIVCDFASPSACMYSATWKTNCDFSIIYSRLCELGFEGILSKDLKYYPKSN